MVCAPHIHTGNGRPQGFGIMKSLTVARYSSLPSTKPVFQPISQDNLRKWKKATREASYICNQVAVLNNFDMMRCLDHLKSSIKRDKEAGQISNLYLLPSQPPAWKNFGSQTHNRRKKVLLLTSQGSGIM